MYGISTSGISDTGRSLVLTIPSTTTTSIIIVTEIGLSNRVFSMVLVFSYLKGLNFNLTNQTFSE